ncbi:MAG: motility protein A [Deltaproteobacteria bacterium]|nr:motility protein A [Deltaproteobacteria bacterium]
MGFSTRRARTMGLGISSGELDRGVISGLGLALGFLVLTLVAGGSGMNFVSPISALLVLGGTFGATLVNYSFRDLSHAWSAFKEMLFVRTYNPMERIDYLVWLAHAVRREGLLVLEGEANSTQDGFLRNALNLTVDAQDPLEIKRLLETEIHASYDRSSRAVQVFETLGTYAPAFGLIGTLIGLIQMLSALEDPATVGPAMGLALVTTFYGALLANLLFLPIAGKLRNRCEAEALVRAITVEGVLGLGKQENPIVVEQRLQSFLPIAAAA